MIAAVGVDASDMLVALHARAFEKPWSADEFAKLLQNPTTFALVSPAVAPVGFILGWAVAGEAEILTVAVAPEARRQGVGRELVTAAAAAAIVRGASSIHLEVAEDNGAARALYAGLGYQETGRRGGYYAGAGAPVDAILMRRDLQGSGGAGAVDSARR